MADCLLEESLAELLVKFLEKSRWEFLEASPQVFLDEFLKNIWIYFLVKSLRKSSKKILESSKKKLKSSQKYIFLLVEKILKEFHTYLHKVAYGEIPKRISGKIPENSRGIPGRVSGDIHEEIYSKCQGESYGGFKEIPAEVFEKNISKLSNGVIFLEQFVEKFLKQFLQEFCDGISEKMLNNPLSPGEYLWDFLEKSLKKSVEEFLEKSLGVSFIENIWTISW